MSVTIANEHSKALMKMVRDSKNVGDDGGKYTNNGSLYASDLRYCISTIVFFKFWRSDNQGFLTHYQPASFDIHVSKIKELVKMIRQEKYSPLEYKPSALLFASKRHMECGGHYKDLIDLISTSMELSFLCNPYTSDHVMRPQLLYYESPLDYIVFSPNQATWATSQHGINSFRP